MAKLYKNESNNIDYFIINLEELSLYNNLPFSICGECLKEFNDEEKIILIPILNEVYCEKCGIPKLNRMHDYKEDRQIQSERTNFYKTFFKNINRLEE